MRYRSRGWLAALVLSGCFWKPDPGPAPLALAEGPVPAVVVPEGEGARLVVAWRAGSAFDPPGQEGLAWLSAHAMARGGSSSRSAEEVAAALEAWGATLEVDVGREVVTFTLRCPPERAPEAAALLAELLRAPRLGPEVGALQAEGLAALQQADQRAPDALARALLALWLYEAHPYGHLPEGRTGSLGALQELHVRQFLDARYVRPALSVAIGGLPEGSPELLAAREALVSGLSSAPPRLSRPPTPRLVPARTDRALLALDRPGEGAALALGHALDLRWEEPDGPALLVAAEALDRRLQAAVGELGTVSAALSEPWESWQGALVVVIEPAAPDRAAEALRRAVREVELFALGGVEEDEIAAARAELLQVEGADPAALAATSAVLGWPDPRHALPARLEVLSPAHVNAAIARQLHPERLSIVFVGPEAERLRDALVEDPASSDVQGAGAASAGTPAGAGYVLDIARVTVFSVTGVFR